MRLWKIKKGYGVNPKKKLISKPISSIKGKGREISYTLPILGETKVGFSLPQPAAAPSFAPRTLPRTPASDRVPGPPAGLGFGHGVRVALLDFPLPPIPPYSRPLSAH